MFTLESGSDAEIPPMPPVGLVMQKAPMANMMTGHQGSDGKRDYI